MNTGENPVAAICVGHARVGDNGAVSTGGLSEFQFNSPIAYRVAGMLSSVGIVGVVFDQYEGGSYGEAVTWLGQELKELGACVAIELHFNAASPDAEGAEYLYWNGSEKGRDLGQFTLDEHMSLFPDATNRGLKPKSPGDRGAGFLEKTPCPSVIHEPFFGSNMVEWEHYSARTDMIAEVYARGIFSFVQRHGMCGE